MIIYKIASVEKERRKVGEREKIKRCVRIAVIRGGGVGISRERKNGRFDKETRRTKKRKNSPCHEKEMSSKKRKKKRKRKRADARFENRPH